MLGVARGHGFGAASAHALTRFGGASTRTRRRAVARRSAWLAADLRAVEEFASLSQLAGGEVGTDQHRGSAPRAKPCGRIRR